MYSCEGIGKTIEKAIENALLELRATKDDVDIKILNEGGLFKKAKVLVTISQDALPKYEKRKKFVENEKLEEKLEKTKEEKITTDENLEVTIQAQELKETSIVSTPAESEEQIETNNNEKVVNPYDFLKGLFEVAGKNVEIDVKEDEKYIHINVTGDDLGDMIGHRGDSFYAISRLTNVLSGKQDKKILLDIGEYKEKRAQSLTALAKRTAAKVAKSGRYIKLLPMNAGDRRVIHTALQDDDRVTTLSKGVEPHRYVIIFPKNED